MDQIVVDAYAWIIYFEGKDEGVNRIMQNGELHTSIFNVAEVASRAERKGQNAEDVVYEIDQLSRVWGADIGNIPRIGKLHAEMRKKQHDFGLGDCFAFELAERLGAKILTGDPHFKGLKNVIFIG